MANVNQQHLIGSLIPDAYIKKITLESGGHPVKETNPHIQHARENKGKFDTAKQSMKVHLDLSVKDTYDGGMIDTWFSDQNFKKYLKLTVVQCTSPLATKILAASNNAIRLANIDSLWEALAFLIELIETIKELPEFEGDSLSTDNALEIYEIISKNIKVKSMSLNDIADGDSLLSQQYDSGQGIYDICHRVSFDVASDKPKHLSYFAATAIDMDQLANDFKLYVDNPVMTDMMSGKTTLDVVIDSGVIKSKSFVYKDLNGDIWTGPVHKVNGAWMAGNPLDASGLILSKEIIENNKVQDFRIFNAIEKVQFDFSSIENEFFTTGNDFKRLTNEELLPGTKSSYFTDLALTMDSVNQSKFVFGINYGKLIKENTRFGNLYSTLNKDELSKNVKIRSMTLKRRRVTNVRFGLNKLGSPVDKRDVFDESMQVPEVLALSGEKSPLVFLKVETFKGTLAELNLEIGLSDIRHFVGVDKTMPNVTDGYYQYGIEMEVEDRTDELILKRLKALAIAKVDFDVYAKEGQSLDNYDVVANRFKKSFVDKQNEKYPSPAFASPPAAAGAPPGQNVLKSPWLKLLIHYFLTFSFLKKSPMTSDMVIALQKMITPSTGSPRGVMMFQKLVDDLLLRAEKLIDTKLKINSATASGESKDAILGKSAPFPHRTFKIEHYFDQAFNSNFPKQLGYDYLSNGIPPATSNTSGLRQISLSDFEARADAETLKYFNSTTANINIANGSKVYNPSDKLENTKWTYLTPSNVNLPLGGACLLANSFDAQENLSMMSAVASMNMDKKSPWSSWFGKMVKKYTKSEKPGLAAATSYSTAFPGLINMATIYLGTLPTPTKFISAGLSPEMLEAYTFQWDPTLDAADLMGHEWDNIDRLFATGSDGLEAQTPQETSPDWSVLSAYLLKQTILGGTGMSSFSSQYDLIPPLSPAKVAQNNTFYSTAFYNLSSGNNAIQKLVASVPSLPPSPQTQNAPNSTIPVLVQNAVFNLPNQIKSLFITDLSVVKKDWHTLSGDVFKMPLYFPTVALNYKMLRVVEVFAGYEHDSAGRPLLKKPIFQRLTPDIKQVSAGKQVLCRTVAYHNLDFGIEPPKGLTLPVYDKYFIMTLPSPALDIPNKGIELYKQMMTAQITKVDSQMQDVPTEYASTKMVASNKILVSQKSKAWVKI